MNEQSARYNPKSVEKKWQAAWAEAQAYKTREDANRPSYYVLSMFPYPSGRIHMGHVRNYAMADVIARLRRAQGYNVLHPMGWDAFGLPAENAAREKGGHPDDWTRANIAQMKGDLMRIGLSYDWAREFATCDPDYYKHQQKIFLDFWKKGLVDRKESYVNWDPVDHTVLANEQVIDGRGWRSGALVEKRKLSQWFFRITAYAEELLADLKTLDRWPERVRLMQENWIGRSEGARLSFPLVGRADAIAIYTTRPDTLWGASFIAIAFDHPLAQEIAQKNPDAARFIDEARKGAATEADIETQEKRGFDTGLRAVHPFAADGAPQDLPVYIANFVLMEYGTGAIFGCPAHDQRDLDFARAYGLPVRPVVAAEGEAAPVIDKTAYDGDGVLVNSGFLNGRTVADAKARVIDEIEKRGLGQRTVNYRLRDWGVSRQRYWGCPIPVIHCDDCGPVPVPDDQLPVTLPKDVTFDRPGNPLDHHPTWKHVDCPKCGKPARRETDTFDTFVDSSWYFARFAAPHAAQPIDKAAANRWLPVDQYVGGIEHAILHLLYARFFTKALRDCGYVDLSEPFAGLFTQGMITHKTFRAADGRWLMPTEVHQNEGGPWVETATGAAVVAGRIEKMSKSKKNVVGLDEIADQYGIDTARWFLLSDSPPERDMEWTTAGIDGAWRFTQRLWRFTQDAAPRLGFAPAAAPTEFGAPARALRQSTHKTIAQVSQDIEAFHFNKAIARLYEFVNGLMEARSKLGDGPDDAFALREAALSLTLLVAPFMPHIAQEMWQAFGQPGWAMDAPWPKADADLAREDEVTIAVQVGGKLRATIALPRDASEDAARAAALADPAIQKILDGRAPRKVIVVPNRIVNLVV